LFCTIQSRHHCGTVLGISVSPRATAMGSAFAGMTDDASALYYNPGAISRLAKSEFIVSHTQWLVGTDFNWLGLVLKFGGDDAVGLQFTQLNYGDEMVTTVEKPRARTKTGTQRTLPSDYPMGEI